MKRNLYNKLMLGCLSGVLVLSAASCKRYLEVEPVSSFGTDYVFSNVPNAEKAVLGIYSALGGDQGYGIRISMYYPYDNDEMMGQGGTPYPDNERRDIAHFNVQPSNTQLAGPFNQLYSGVERANICIYNIPRMAMYTSGSAFEQSQLKHMLGEALTLRAQFYFELIRNWGDVPAHFLPSSLETDLFKAKTDRDSIYDVLLSDLQEAATLVPWRSATTVTNERITQGAVRALRARIALFRGGYSLRLNRQMERPANYKDFYQIALDECKAIMDKSSEHNLNSSFQAVFKDALGAKRQEPNGEIIWEVGMSGGGSGFGDSKLGYYNGPRYNNQGNSALTILPSYFYAFDSADTRRDVTCAPYNIAADRNLEARTLQTMVDGKFRRDWTNQLTSAAQYFGTNWPMIRFSDVLLMYAEADNELNNGPSAAAKAAFEKVRLRAYGGDASKIGVTPSDYTGFFNAVMKERMLELGGEGIRKYDLLRWNKLKERIDATKAQLEAMASRQAPYDQYPATMYYIKGTPYMNWANSFYKPSPSPAPAGSTSVAWVGTGIRSTILTYYAIGFTAGKSELLPIPISAREANPFLTQDFGY
ncbi:RagB/SusD family nutrient uptake outer membrane protein [Parasegetibacter sp. NRK P23]|uniref:RagB/SusD family nutrient uptake outer membrane protein n=1 Tax=Parasegetibacter sp. NRK P23 TaxID=2942999 RepID=UPI0020434344|nr:RagB/SusD family nutrient uptake outer membrane protein [Parasegetibacter sp. NRK P23]MCM5527293.1 RagB/SusD family nutrient uptake outer membrane protein [Parasegetibacter sp. NRK P23]